MQPLENCIGPIIRIGRESWCLPYAGFLYSRLAPELVSRNVKKRKSLGATVLKQGAGHQQTKSVVVYILH